MRVAYELTPGVLAPAGVGRYLRDLRGALLARGDTELVELAATSGRRTTTAGRIAQGLYREAVYFPLVAAHRARAAHVDLLHVPGPFGPAGLRGLPLVLTLHDVMAWTHPEFFTTANSRHSQLVVGPAARRAARVMTTTEHVRGEIVEHLGVDPGRVVLTTFGVHERFRPVAVDHDLLAERWGIHGRFVLTVGTLEPRKNLRGALQAFDRVAARDPDLQLVVVGGTGWHLPDADRLLAGERIVRTGFVDDDDLVTLYSAAECLVFPSLAEGVGLPPLEAMACGTPVVAGDRTSLPEVVGDAGLLVDPEDVDAIAAGIQRLLGDAELAARMRERGIERTRSMTWERAAEETVAVYRDAVADRR